MSKGGKKRSRWRDIPRGWRATCSAEGCEVLVQSYCRDATCRRPYCDEHKGQHVVDAHTRPRLEENGAGDPSLSLEALSLLAKIRKQRRVRSVRWWRDPAAGTYWVEAVGHGENPPTMQCGRERLERASLELLEMLRGTPLRSSTGRTA